MRKLRELFKFIPLLCLPLLCGLSVFGLAHHNIKETKADDVLFYSYRFTPNRVVLSSSTNNTISVNTTGGTFYNGTFSFYRADTGTSLSYYATLDYSVHLGHSLASSSYSNANFSYSVLNLPTSDFVFYLKIESFAFVEKIQDAHASIPVRNLIWSYQLVIGNYVNDILYSTNTFDGQIVISNSESYNSYDFSTIDFDSYTIVTPSSSGFLPADYSRTIVDVENILDDRYNAGYNAGYTAGYQNGNDVGNEVGYDSGYRVGYSDGNQVGYNQGYPNGYDNGVTDGYSQGYTAGASDGYSQGYTAGYNAADNEDEVVNSIFSGILQVGFLPVEFFLAIFNFEILGINLTSVVASLLTICFTLLIIKAFKGFM